jgi:flagella synthesis protein FlgN
MHSSGTAPATTLHDEHATAQRLVELLEREQAHLINADIEALAVVTEEKTQAVGHMAALTTARYKALAAIGFAGEEAGMQQWLDSASAPSSARDAWSALLKLVQAAKELNRTNGLLINKHMSRNEAALHALRGNPQPNSFYGPNGQATAKSGSRGLVVG